ncbi:MAG: HAMP domain-containing protein, partial [Lentisphaerae bacterium]|nr:HAMP domain-containing protein [Lentisphaerota bacterium]
MSKRKLSTQLLMGFAGVVLVSLGLVSIALGIVLRRDYVAQAAERFGEDVDLHAEELRRAAERGDRPELDRLCEVLNGDFGGRVSLIGRDGSILADSISARCAARARPDCLPMVRKQQELRLQTYMPLNETFTIRWPIRLGPLGPATARLALPIGPVRQQLRHLYALLLGTGLAASVLAVWLGVRLSRRLAQPIEAMTTGAERIAAGDLEHPVQAEGQDEIGRLGEALETMRCGLRSNLAAITKERNQALAIVKDMSDGVICLSDTGSIIFANQAAALLLGRPQIPSSQASFADVSVPEALSAAVHQTMELGAEATTEFGDIRTGERVVRVVVTPVEDASVGTGRGAVLVLRDMTEARRAEAMGKELVANASHELRTPLAIIASTADTILTASDSEPEAVREFAGIISRHAVRMERLVKETLQLTRLEGGNADWQWEKLSAGELVQQ